MAMKRSRDRGKTEHLGEGGREGLTGQGRPSHGLLVARSGADHSEAVAGPQRDRGHVSQPSPHSRSVTRSLTPAREGGRGERKVHSMKTSYYEEG